MSFNVTPLGAPPTIPLEDFTSSFGVLLSSRADAEAATIPASVTSLSVIHNGVRLDYIADAAGTALTTADGRTWAVAGEPIAILFLGQSNMRSHVDMTGGDMTIDPRISFWNGNETQVGTDFVTPELSIYPLDTTADSGATYSNNYAYAICREMSRKTGRPVYGVMYAQGSHPAVAFVTPAGRTANGWTLGGGLTDLSAFMYPGIANALAAIPNGPAAFDYVHVHQGESDKASSNDYADLVAAWQPWKRQWSVVFDELEAAGVYNRTDTIVTFGQMTDSPNNNDDRMPQWMASGELFVDLLGNLRFVHSTKLPLASSSNHFSGEGIVALAKRAVGGAMGPEDMFGPITLEFSPTLTLSDAETGGNLATLSSESGLLRATFRMFYDGDTGGRPIGMGADITVSAQLTGIDTTGMTAMNDLYMPLQFPCRNGNAALYFGTGKTDNIDFNDQFTVSASSGRKAARFNVNVSTGVQRNMRVNELSANAKMFFSFNYTSEIRTYA